MLSLIEIGLSFLQLILRIVEAGHSLRPSLGHSLCAPSVNQAVSASHQLHTTTECSDVSTRLYSDMLSDE
jgi:hypothetical protein